MDCLSGWQNGEGVDCQDTQILPSVASWFWNEDCPSAHMCLFARNKSPGSFQLPHLPKAGTFILFGFTKTIFAGLYFFQIKGIIVFYSISLLNFYSYFLLMFTISEHKPSICNEHQKQTHKLFDPQIALVLSSK